MRRQQWLRWVQIALVVAFGVLFARIGLAQTQRLGLPAGKFTIGPGQEAVRETFCMDVGLEAPSPGKSLSHVLTDPTQVLVTIGGNKPIPLSEAIEQKLVSIEAVEKSLSDYEAFADERRRLDKIKRDDSGTLAPIMPTLMKRIATIPASEALVVVRETAKTIRDAATSSQQQQARAEQQLKTLRKVEYLLEAARGLGGFRHVRIVNKNPKQKITIDVQKPVVMSEEKGLPVTDIDADGFSASTAKPRSWSELQDLMWAANAVRGIHQLGDVDVAAYNDSPAKRSNVLTYQRYKGESYVLLNMETGPIELRKFDGSTMTTLATGVAAIDQLDAVSKAMVRAKTTANAALIHTSPTDGKTIEFRIGSVDVQLTSQEAKDLLGGKVVASVDKALAGSQRKQFIVWRDAFDRADRAFYHLERDHVSPLQLLGALQATYGKAYEFFLASHMDEAIARTSSIPSVKTASDIGIVVDKGTFAVIDHGAIAQIEHLLGSTGMQKIASSASSAPQSNIIVISGHADASYLRYVESMANNGLLRDKYVVLFSCYFPASEQFNTDTLLKKGKAKAVLMYGQKIDPQAVAEVIAELDKLVRGGATGSLKELLDKSVTAAKKNPVNVPIADEIEKMRAGIVQLSSVSPVRLSDQKPT